MLVKMFRRRSRFNICNYLISSASIVLIVYLILPHRFASHYDYIKEDRILHSLVERVTPNISLQQLPHCSYSEVIDESSYVYGRSDYHEDVLHSEEIRSGGEYFPHTCRPRYSTAIIVPYRKREKQLHKFLTYMHNYLRLQRIHYRIFLVEQYDQKPFNRATLFNIGARIANEYDFPCLILHDVDLLPLNTGQLYACSELPRHMCSALDHWRFHLPYRGLFGGVVAINTIHFQMINGMSNLYHGWGGEDDDLYARLRAHGFDMCRFAPAFSEYTMLKHKPERPNENRVALLHAAAMRFETDGLNSLVFTEVERRMHSLFTHILVRT